jgi:hypothetical protein
MQLCTNIVHIPTIDVHEVLQDEIVKASETKRPPGSGKPGSRRFNAWSERQRSMHEAMKNLATIQEAIDHTLGQ